MHFRLRGPGGVATNCTFEENATFADLLAEACKLAGSAACTILVGFPPAPLACDPTALMADVVRNGDMLTVKPSGVPPFAASAPPAAASAPPADDDDDLQLALALSRGETAVVPQSPVPEADVMIRRVIPADNSCLFAAVAYALEGGVSYEPAKNAELRQHVASAVRAGAAAADERFSEAMLGRPPAEYAAWITGSDHWGGATELDILSDRYLTELAAVDVKTGRVDVFGQGRGYSQRAFLLYDGIHYDTLVRTLNGAPQDFDVSVFAANDGRAVAQAQAVAAEARRARDFTDVSSFTIRCLVCQKGLTGEAEAVEHAKATSHTNFSEYR